ncbi:hypothetical protein FM119_02275 [Mycetocola reblochoni REB411]|uniref:Uncharacterized protein n=1 Tax=Mycetocola reblochoni REB411 TaxID=1255698 RepID=A0A1R4IL28_9MICO|nr:hypothetical protein FM119_02275 [Mycetocola reblochoni REB411]
MRTVHACAVEAGPVLVYPVGGSAAVSARRVPVSSCVGHRSVL